MSSKTMKFTCAIALAVAAIGVKAQEMGAPQNPSETVSSVSEEKVELPVVLDDAEKSIAAVEAGGKTLQEYQRQIDSQQETYRETSEKAATKLFKDAQTIVGEKLGKLTKKDKDGKTVSLAEDFEEDSQSIIVIGTAEAVVVDPATDESFIGVRNIKALEAYLDAKSEIIKALETQFDACARADTKYKSLEPETDFEKEFEKRMNLANDRRKKLAQKIAQMDELQGAEVRGISIGEHFGSLLDAAIKKLDATYDPAKATADKVALRDQIAKECAALKKEAEELEAVAKTLPKVPVNELNSGVTLYAQMPLLGANVLVQSESWNRKTHTYQVAMAVVWSPKLQERALAVLKGDFKAERCGKLSINDWMSQQTLSCMLGPRRMVDDHGRNINFGFAAADMDCATTLRKAKKYLANAFATQFVAFSLIGDIETYTEAKSTYKDYHNSWTKEDKAKFTESLLSHVAEKSKGALKGCMPISKYAKEYVHAISGHRIYVAPYHLNPRLASESKGLIRKSFVDAGLATKAMNAELGERTGQRDALKAIQDSPEDFQSGYEKGRSGVESDVKKRLSEKATFPKTVQNPVASGVEGSSSSERVKKSKGGAYSGDAAVDTDF